MVLQRLALTLISKKKAVDTYSISISVAGFSAHDIFIEVKENALIIANGKNGAS